MVHTVCNSGSNPGILPNIVNEVKIPVTVYVTLGTKNIFFLTFVYLIFLLWLFKRGVLQPLCDKLAYLKKYCFMKKVLND